MVVVVGALVREGCGWRGGCHECSLGPQHSTPLSHNQYNQSRQSAATLQNTFFATSVWCLRGKEPEFHVMLILRVPKPILYKRDYILFLLRTQITWLVVRGIAPRCTIIASSKDAAPLCYTMSVNAPQQVVVVGGGGCMGRTWHFILLQLHPEGLFSLMTPPDLHWSSEKRRGSIANWPRAAETQILAPWHSRL